MSCGQRVLDGVGRMSLVADVAVSVAVASAMVTDRPSPSATGAKWAIVTVPATVHLTRRVPPASERRFVRSGADRAG